MTWMKGMIHGEEVGQLKARESELRFLKLIHSSADRNAMEICNRIDFLKKEIKRLKEVARE